MNVKNNRKAKLTRRIFSEALIDLLQEYHISEISVKKLCEAADMNRSTFYAHYENQMSLLNEIVEETSKTLEDIVKEAMTYHSKEISFYVFTKLLENMKNNPKLFTALLNSGDSNNLRNLLYKLSRNHHRRISSGNEMYSEQDEVYIQYFRVDGCISVAKKWLENDFKEPVEHIARLIVSLTDFPCAKITK